MTQLAKDLIDKYKTLDPTNAKCTLSSDIHRRSQKIINAEHVLGHKTTIKLNEPHINNMDEFHKHNEQTKQETQIYKCNSISKTSKHFICNVYNSYIYIVVFIKVWKLLPKVRKNGGGQSRRGFQTTGSVLLWTFLWWLHEC